MALAHFQRTFADLSGNVQRGIFVTISKESDGSPATLFSDPDGASAKPNPFTTSLSGYADFFVETGRYRVQAPGIDWRYIDIVGQPDTPADIPEIVIRATSVADVESLAGTSGRQALMAGSRAGAFEFSSADLSSEVSADVQQGVYIAPASDPTGASGAWVRTDIGSLTPAMFGVGDDGQDYSAERAAFYKYFSEQSSIVDSLPAAWTAWTPKPQPPARTDLPNNFTDGFGNTAEEFLSGLWEPLRAKNPSYISRTALGPDESGLHTVWQYTFEPPEYDRTLIVIGALHGSEITGMLGFYLFMKSVCEDWKEEPQLANLRWRTRIVSVPLANPYGVSQSPRTRQNANGVDINRNFDYLWSTYPTGVAFDQDYKGTAAFSEIESRYIRDLVVANSDALAFIDMHNFGGGSIAHYPVYVPGESPGGSIIDDVIYAFRKPSEGIQYDRTYNPSGFTWAAKNYGMYAYNPEWADGLYGAAIYDGEDLTKAVRWYGNIILAHSFLQSKALALTSMGPRCVFASYSGTSITSSSTVAAKVPEFQVDINVGCPGYLKVHSSVTVSCDDASAVVFIRPRIIHFGYGKFGPGDTFSGVESAVGPATTENYESMDSISARRTISAFSMVPVFPTDTTKTLSVGLFLHTSAGIVNIRRYRAMIEFVPTGSGDIRSTFFRADGNSGPDAMVKVLPAT